MLLRGFMLVPRSRMMLVARFARAVGFVEPFICFCVSKQRATDSLANSRVRANSSVWAMPNWARAKSSSSAAERTCSSAARS